LGGVSGATSGRGVGTCFTAASASALKRQMDKIAIDAPAVDTDKKRPNVTWVKPELAAEINFRAWTG
jgi:bifunctional non-homologous end joining protein LigD